MALPCIPENFKDILCGLQETVAQLVIGAGHPPMSVSWGAGAMAFDAATQTLYINVPTIPATPAPEVVQVADGTARAALAPTKLNSLLIQVTDAANGGYSVWAATGLAAGNWTLKTASMAIQSASNVSITGGSITGITDLLIADGGTGASTAAGARQNLALATATPVASAINWLASTSFFEAIAGATAYTFTNTADGLSIMVAVASPGAFAVTWPAGVKWTGGVAPAHTGAGTTVVYAFVQIGGVIYGSYVDDYTT